MLKKIYIKYSEIINYLIVGGLTTVVSLGTYYGLVFNILNPHHALQLQIANIISWIASVTFAYFFNKKYVFKSTESKILKEMFSFYSARTATLIMDMAIMFIFVTKIGLDDKIIKIVVQIIVTILNYIFSKVFVFRKDE